MSELKWNHVRYILDIGDGTERYLEVCDYEDTGYMEFTLNEFRGGDIVELSAKFYDYGKGFDEDSCEDEDWKTCSVINVHLIFDVALEMVKQYKEAKRPKTYEQLEMEANIKKLEWTIAEQQLEIERLRQKELELSKGNNNE